MNSNLKRYSRWLASFLSGLAMAQFCVPASAASIYPTWKDGSTYTAGTVVNYSSNNYQARQNHTATAGAGWTPAAAPSLWQNLGTDSPAQSPSGYPFWYDGGVYQAGTMVYFEGRNYKALQTHTAYFGTNWTPAVASSLWQDLGIAAPQDTLSIYIEVGATVDTNNVVRVGWRSPYNSEIGVLYGITSSYTPYFTTNPPYGRPQTSSNVEWQLFDNGKLVSSSMNYIVNAPSQRPNEYTPPTVSGLGTNMNTGGTVNYFTQGTHNLTVRICNKTSRKCYISKPKTVNVPAAPVIRAVPPKTALAFTRSIDEFGYTRLQPIIQTPLISNPLALSEDMAIAEVKNGVLNRRYGGGLDTVTVASGCPPMPDGKPAQQCYYQYIPSNATPLTITQRPSTNTFVLLLCNSYRDICSSSDPVTVTVP